MWWGDSTLRTCPNKNKNCDLDHLYNYIKLYIHADNTTVTINKILFFAKRGEDYLKYDAQKGHQQ